MLLLWINIVLLLIQGAQNDIDLNDEAFLTEFENKDDILTDTIHSNSPEFFQLIKKGGGEKNATVVNLVIEEVLYQLSKNPKNQTGRQQRLFGATTTGVSIANAPFMAFVSVVRFDGLIEFCGGALVTHTLAVTSAQCVHNAVSIVVFAGISDIDSDIKTALNRVGTAYIHRNFERTGYKYDFAIVQLSSAFPFGGFIRPAFVPNRMISPYSVDKVTFRIWGYGFNTANKFGSQLGYVEQTQLTRTTCRTAMQGSGVEYFYGICCLDTHGSTVGSCKNDVGDPVLMRRPLTSDYVLMGVMSAYHGCPSSYPVGYTPLGPYLRWLMSFKAGLSTVGVSF